MKKYTLSVLVVLVVILALGGWLWYGKYKLQQAQIKQESTSTQPQEQVWYPIPELGIEVQLSKDIADDLVYKYEETPVTEFINGKYVPMKDVIRKSALFSTKTLIALDSQNCSLDYSPAGIMSREEGRQIIGDSNVTLWQGKAIQFDSFYMYYQGSQAACTENQKILDYTSKVMVSLSSVFQNDSNFDSRELRVRELKK